MRSIHNKTGKYFSKIEYTTNKTVKKYRTRKISQKTYHKNKKQTVQGKLISEKEGWKVIEVRGEPYEMGYAHGYILADELREILELLPFIVKEELKIPFSHYLAKSRLLITPIIKSKYPDIYQELKGISAGARDKKIHVSVDFLISWNAYMSLYSLFENINKRERKANQRCSAFIATGSATEKGDIVMAHNTHSTFTEGQFMNIIMYLKPNTGFPFVMQTSPGFISSISDWFVCESGIIGCETTIAYTNYIPSFGNPVFCRIRQAMQYANSLDEYVEIMLDGNSGDYACSWQFGNVNTGEIMLFEIGLEKYSIQRTMNGVYYGMNSAIDWALRKKETDNVEIFNSKTSTGSRNFRLNYLLNDKYYGKINTENAKTILADHYDMFLGKSQMNHRSICIHYEQDHPVDNEKVQPNGCIDGKVVNTIMAKKMEFIGKFGSSCNRIFNKNEFIKKHPEYKNFHPFMRDFPTRKWIRLRKPT
jgi:dsDNA-binding SOS-regulon protein